MNKALMLLGALWLCACRPTEHEVATVTVQRSVIDTNPIYSGHIQALRTIDVTAPYDGTLEQLKVQMGQTVRAQQPLLAMRSEAYVKDIQQALLDFLKAKDDYHNQSQKYLGAQQLWQHGLISANDYHSQRSDLASSYAVLLQQQSKLEAYWPHQSRFRWSLEDRTQLSQLFSEASPILSLHAPIDGIVLSPSKTSSHNETPSGLLPTVGSALKQGDSLLTIADVSGYVVDIRVSQMQVNALSLGQKATITGDAFDESLAGYISQIGLQANADPNAGDDSAPTYVVEIRIPSTPRLMQQPIRLGMSAKVTLLSQVKASLTIPLSAVGFLNQQPVVMRKVDHRIHITPIKTGKTSVDRVQVLAGLSEGDTILATYPT